EGSKSEDFSPSSPVVKRWIIRLMGDQPEKISPAFLRTLAQYAGCETDAQFRSQLASTLKRLKGKDSLQVLEAMFSADCGDEKDPHIPLLLWWAVEARLSGERDDVIQMAQRHWDNQ